MKKWLADKWFILGLLAVAAITTADSSEWTVRLGRMLKNHHGTDIVIVLIFFFSGWVLEANQIKTGLVDTKASLTALMTIFLIAPLIAWGMGYLPMDIQIKTGLFIVAVMPSTLSSGVVMTGLAGGNMAHALVVTILANTAAVLTIPLSLGLLLSSPESARNIEIDKGAITLQIGLLVLTPLVVGVMARFKSGPPRPAARKAAQRVNQVLILVMVWMALSQGRNTLVNHLGALMPIGIMVFVYHLILILISVGLVRSLNLPSGRRESVILMGAQKTLPLSVILQVRLFPDYGLTLVVCVAHHIIHLIMDGYVVRRLRQWKA
jgi:sodium/bile acid cotransporter 7